MEDFFTFSNAAIRTVQEVVVALGAAAAECTPSPRNSAGERSDLAGWLALLPAALFHRTDELPAAAAAAAAAATGLPDSRSGHPISATSTIVLLQLNK